jgi:hypothetical protein
VAFVIIHVVHIIAIIYVFLIIAIIHVLSGVARFDSGRRIDVDSRGALALFEPGSAFLDRAIAVVGGGNALYTGAVVPCDELYFCANNFGTAYFDRCFRRVRLKEPI